jgi:glucosamine 6-phosphate synthetase-like amidotransferase/phosphosugar isomerase protein
MPIADTRREVAGQPAVIAGVLENLRNSVREVAVTLAKRATRQLFVLGSGDSWFAGQAARLALEHYAGLPTEPLQAYEYAAYGHPGFEAHSAAIVISSSGRPTTTWDALDRALAGPAYFIGISDKRYEGNPFIEKPPATLVPGAQKKGLPAQTTTATIAVLIDLAIELGRATGHLDKNQAADYSSQLRAIPVQMATVLAASETVATHVAQAFRDCRFYTLVGGGPSFGVANTGSALLAEGPQEVGLPLAVEEFHHALRFGTIAGGEPVILIAPTGRVSDRNLDTARSVSNWGARLIAIVDEADKAITALADTVFTLPEVPEPMSPLLTLLPLHQLAIRLAEQKLATGYRRPTRVP